MAADLSTFRDLEDEFKRQSSTLPTRISTISTHESNADRAQAELRSAERDLFSCKQHLSDMEREARSMPDPTRRELGNRIRSYKDSLATIQRDLDRARDKFSHSALMAGSSADLSFSDSSRAQHQRLIDSNTRLAEGTDRLESTRRVLGETEDVALGISEQLHRDRQVISGIRDKTAETGGLMDNARRIVRSMSRRECQQKLIMACFALFLLAAIILIVYFAFIKPEQDKQKSKRALQALPSAVGAVARALRGMAA